MMAISQIEKAKVRMKIFSIFLQHSKHSLLKDGMMTIETALPTQGVEVQELSVKNLYAQNFWHAINDSYQSEQFYVRPDCVALLWNTLLKNENSILIPPFINWIETSLIETLAHPSCKQQWCLRGGVLYHSDLNKTLEMLKSQPEYVIESYKTSEMSIKEIAESLKREKDNYGQRSDYMVKLLMMRVQLIACDEYHEQGWPEDSPAELVDFGF